MGFTIIPKQTRIKVRGVDTANANFISDFDLVSENQIKLGSHIAREITQNALDIISIEVDNQTNSPLNDNDYQDVFIDESGFFNSVDLINTDAIYNISLDQYQNYSLELGTFTGQPVIRNKTADNVTKTSSSFSGISTSGTGGFTPVGFDLDDMQGWAGIMASGMPATVSPDAVNPELLRFASSDPRTLTFTVVMQVFTEDLGQTNSRTNRVVKDVGTITVPPNTVTTFSWKEFFALISNNIAIQNISNGELLPAWGAIPNRGTRFKVICNFRLKRDTSVPSPLGTVTRNNNSTEATQFTCEFKVPIAGQGTPSTNVLNVSTVTKTGQDLHNQFYFLAASQGGVINPDIVLTAVGRPATGDTFEFLINNNSSHETPVDVTLENLKIRLPAGSRANVHKFVVHAYGNAAP